MQWFERSQLAVYGQLFIVFVPSLHSDKNQLIVATGTLGYMFRPLTGHWKNQGMYLNNIIPCWPDDGRLAAESYSRV